jgi:cytochrome b6-f complex iron-sulfur subunit
MSNEEVPNPQRRDFLAMSWRIVGALALGEGAYLGLRFLSSRKAEGEFGQVVIAGVVDDFPPGTVTPFETDRFFLVRFEDGGFLALCIKCTHLACNVNWNPKKQRFQCPCHGSEFQQNGAVLNPPAPRPLDRYSVIIQENGKVEVDTRQRLQRQQADSADWVYPPPTPEPETTIDDASTPSLDLEPTADADSTPAAGETAQP